MLMTCPTNHFKDNFLLTKLPASNTHCRINSSDLIHGRVYKYFRGSGTLLLKDMIHCKLNKIYYRSLRIA